MLIATYCAGDLIDQPATKSISCYQPISAYSFTILKCKKGNKKAGMSNPNADPSEEHFIAAGFIFVFQEKVCGGFLTHVVPQTNSVEPLVQIYRAFLLGTF